MVKKLNVYATTCGGYGLVTGSCTLIEFENSEGRTIRFLVDCGMFQGSKGVEKLNEVLLFDPKNIDYVFVTHGHSDHIGRLPYIQKNGFRGRIFASPVTVDIAPDMLFDTADVLLAEAMRETAKSKKKHNEEKRKINEMNKKRNRRGKKDILKERRKRDAEKQVRGFVPSQPLFCTDDVVATLPLSESIRENRWINIDEGLKVKFVQNGHILGSCSLEVETSNGDQTIQLAFSGDLGTGKSYILKNKRRQKNDKVKVVFSESTNVARQPVDPKAGKERLAKIIVSGGRIHIVAFSLNRAQEMIYLIKTILKENGLDGLKTRVCIDAPLAVRLTKAYNNHPECLKDEIVEEGYLDIDDLFVCNSKELSKKLVNNLNDFVVKNLIIITSGGMAQGGRVLYHCAEHLKNKNAKFVFVGYQAQGTLGRHLIEGAKPVKVLGSTRDVEAQIHYIQDFSSHADVPALYKYYSLYPNANTIILGHGEYQNSVAFARKLEKDLDIKTKVPVIGEKYLITTDEVTFVQKIDVAHIIEEQKQKSSKKIS